MRRQEISILKAIGIILMVVGHSGCPALLRDAIYQFHMPLFFIASGMCLKEEHIGNIKGFVIRKIKGVWWPYVKYGTLFLLLHNVFYHLNIYNSSYGYLDSVSNLYTIKDFLWKFTKVIRMTGSEQLLGGFWFLHALFWGSIIGVLTLSVLKKKSGVTLILLMIFTLLFCYFNVDIRYVYITSTTLLAASFFLIGYICKNIKNTDYIYPVAIIAIVLGILYGADGMMISKMNLIVPYIIVATLCTLAVYQCSKLMLRYEKLSNCLAYIGDNSLQILVWHFLSFKLVSLLIIVIYDLPIESLAKFPVIEDVGRGWWLAYVLVGVVIPLLVQRIFQYCDLIARKLMFKAKIIAC